MIGHVQSNKAAKAVRLFDSIDSVDSVALAEKLDRAREEFNTEITEKHGEQDGTDSVTVPGNLLRVLIEVKLDPEPAKSGVDGRGLATTWWKPYCTSHTWICAA